MSGLFTRWRRERLLRQARRAPSAWHLPPWTHRLPPAARERLHEQVALFLAEKPIEGAQGFPVDESMRLNIATQACLPVLGLGYDWLDDLPRVIVYPDEFIPLIEEIDEIGLVHRREEIRAGEAWSGGPLVLSWSDVEAFPIQGEAYNVVFHEIAHVLDMREGGEPNGFPPLPEDLPAARWTEVFSAAYTDMNTRLDRGEETELDPYAADAPEEFFAVASETFLVTPSRLRAAYPAVYAQLAAFYRLPFAVETLFETPLTDEMISPISAREGKLEEPYAPLTS